MGRGKKKQFINKKESSKFVLLHRSQQDADYGKEGSREEPHPPATTHK